MEARTLRALQFRLNYITARSLINVVLELPLFANNREISHAVGFLHDLAIHEPAFATEAPAEMAAAILLSALRATRPGEVLKWQEEAITKGPVITGCNGRLGRHRRPCGPPPCPWARVFGHLPNWDRRKSVLGTAAQKGNTLASRFVSSEPHP